MTPPSTIEERVGRLEDWRGSVRTDLRVISDDVVEIRERLKGIEARLTLVETTLGQHGGMLTEILRRLPDPTA